jgi:hypothetical protein
VGSNDFTSNKNGAVADNKWGMANRNANNGGDLNMM